MFYGVFFFIDHMQAWTQSNTDPDPDPDPDPKPG